MFNDTCYMVVFKFEQLHVQQHLRGVRNFGLCNDHTHRPSADRLLLWNSIIVDDVERRKYISH